MNSNASRPRGKRGPAPWPADRVRSRPVTVLLTPPDYERLADAARVAGVPVSRYVADLVNAVTAQRNAA